MSLPMIVERVRDDHAFRHEAERVPDQRPVGLLEPRGANPGGFTPKALGHVVEVFLDCHNGVFLLLGQWHTPRQGGR